MTVENCIGGCTLEGYTVCGVENSRDCYCGKFLPPAVLKANITDCEVMMCSGNTTEFCAAISRLAVYA